MITRDFDFDFNPIRRQRLKTLIGAQTYKKRIGWTQANHSIRPSRRWRKRFPGQSEYCLVSRRNLHSPAIRVSFRLRTKARAFLKD